MVFVCVVEALQPKQHMADAINHAKYIRKKVTGKLWRNNGN
jgi:hypothetical protein